MSDRPMREVPPPRIYGWRVRLAWWFIRLGCRHPVGTVCFHRHWDYDNYLRGLHDGYGSGIAYERDRRP